MASTAFLLLLAFLPVPASASAIPHPVNNLGLVGYWPLDDGAGTTARDVSGGGNNGTIVNSGSVWTTGQLGGALQFTGNGSVSGQYITTSYLQNNVTNYTIAYWVKTTASGFIGAVVNDRGSGAGKSITATIGHNSGARPDCLLDSNSLGAGVYATNAVVNDGNWHQVVCIFSSTAGQTITGSNFSIYVDGAAAATTIVNPAGSATSPITGLSGTQIGFENLSGWDNYLNATLDDVRIYNRALSANDVTFLYRQGLAQVVKARLNTNPTVVPAQNFLNGLVGYWPMEEGTGAATRDVSGNGNVGTLVNSPTWVKGKYGSALSFNGTNQRVSIKPIGLSTSGSVSAWVLVTGSGTPDGNGDEDIVADVASTGAAGWSMGFKPSSNLVSFYIAGSGESLSTHSLSRNTWHSVTVTYDGTNKRIYLDGALDSIAAASVNGADTGDGWGFASRTSALNRFFQGNIDDVRIYNRTLSAAEIKQLYLNESVNIGHSIAVVPNGLVGWWTLDGNNLIQNVKDSSGQGNNGNFVGFTSTSSAETAGKIGGALKFNGTSSYIPLKAGAILFGLPSFSVCAWFNTKQLSPDTFIYDEENLGGPALLLRVTGGSLQFGVNNGSAWSFATSATVLSVNKWYHGCGVYSSAGTAVYLNGGLGGSSAITGENPSPISNTKIGAWGAGQNVFNGALDDVRIYNRALTAQEVQTLYTAGK